MPLAAGRNLAKNQGREAFYISVRAKHATYSRISGIFLQPSCAKALNPIGHLGSFQDQRRACAQAARGVCTPFVFRWRLTYVYSHRDWYLISKLDGLCGVGEVAHPLSGRQPIYF